jgi:FlaA1/EpsC-like NDP-sugar epimerase
MCLETETSRQEYQVATGGDTMKYKRKLSILLPIDMGVIWISLFSSYYLRFMGDIWPLYVKQMWVAIVVTSVICPLVMIALGMYNQIWRYAGVRELMTLLKAVLLLGLSSYGLVNFIFEYRMPISVFLLNMESMLLMMGGVRLYQRWRSGHREQSKGAGTRVLIIGAGDCGELLVKELLNNKDTSCIPVAFVDDDTRKHHLKLHGLPVIGGRECVGEAVDKMNIQEIIIAMPSMPAKETAFIIELCRNTKAKLKIVPRYRDVIHGNFSIKHIRDVEVEDLLDRESVRIDLDGIAGYVTSKVVLVTGAGGSIGLELCRQILRFNPKKLLLLGHGENSIYLAEKELRNLFPDSSVESIIADVCDKRRIDIVFKNYRPEVIFHAAAHKHVPLMEKNVSEAIKNNVFGTLAVAECADRYEADRFVLISTDKAVNPSSIMGVTKCIAEMIILSFNQKNRTKFAAVRFGNVLGSRGSVIPLFKEQIAKGGPVTVTHPEMTRYFMTIPEAVSLVIQAGAFTDGGEIYILDMGKPVKIFDLATALIRLSGYKLFEDIDIVFTGIRQGEKLHEELFTKEEGLLSTKHDRIYVSRPEIVDRNELNFQLRMLSNVIAEEKEIIPLLKRIVPGFLNVS